MSRRPVLEVAALRSLAWLVVGLVPVPILLLLDAPGPDRTTVTVHLSVLVGFGIVLAGRLAPLAHHDWFTFTRLGPAGRFRAGTAALVALVTGVVALLTLASSAALRYDPSLQFLQLLSALDIAWAAAAVLLGTRFLRDGRTAYGAAALLGGFCVWSIWNYLRIFGFAPDGGWLVDGAGLMRWVLPFDMAAAALALGIWWRAPAAYLTAQRSPQS